MVGVRQRRRADARERVLDAALDLFAERGYGVVTVADVCAAADIAPRTFYRYFATKEEVLAAPVRAMAQRLCEAVRAAPAHLSPAQAMDAAVLALGEEVVSASSRVVRLLRAVREQAATGPRPVTALAEQERDLAQALHEHGGGSGPPDWRVRLLAAHGTADLRVWITDLMDDPGAARGDLDADRALDHLREVLAAR